MQKFEIKVGEEYLLREVRKADALLQRVKVLQHIRGKKWRAEWIDPNTGLVEYVGRSSSASGRGEGKSSQG